jgi:hypothetical protein
VAAALEPFEEMSTEQSTDLLRISDEYRQMGKLPEWVVNNTAGSAKRRAPKAPKDPKLTAADAVAKLKDIQQRCISMDPAQIAQEVQGLSVMTINELKNVQRDFLGVVIGKRKEDLLASLQ